MPAKNRDVTRLDHIREKVDKDVTTACLLELKELENNLEKLQLQEEIYWKQRSRNLWLNAWDRNTTYFPRYTSTRKKKNAIYRLRKEDNTVASSQKDLELIVFNFFGKLFSTQDPSFDDIQDITNLLPRLVSPNMNESLDQPFSREEIKKALFDLHPSKAPGPDGFTALFFQMLGRSLEITSPLSQWRS